MLKDATAHGIRKVYIACGFTDLRTGIDGLSLLVQEQFLLNPLEKGTLFLFCGRKSDRIKGLLSFRYRNYSSYSDILLIPIKPNSSYKTQICCLILSE